jgi:nitroreductase
MDVLTAIRTRASTRAFLDKPVPKTLIHELLDIARYTPSGTNTQPWQVAVLMGTAKAQLCQAIVEAFDHGQKGNPDYQYYPQEFFGPLKARRVKCGLALYNALGIAKEDTEGRKAQWRANYRFFDAPVGLFLLLDKRLATGSWFDLGMFAQSIMLAAKGLGLDTCPQAALAEYPDIVRQHLNLSDSLQVACGMAIGYADPNHPINQYRTEREEVDSFTQWFE